MENDTSVNLTAIMEREGIRSITRVFSRGPYSVELVDRRVGTAATIGEALTKAKADTYFADLRAA